MHGIPLRKTILAMGSTLVALLIAAVPSSGLSQLVLKPNQIRLRSGKTFKLYLPPKYEIIPAAEGLRRVRFFARSFDGRIFVTDLYNLTDNRRGRVLVLGKPDKQSGLFKGVSAYLSGLRNPNSIAFYRDGNGQRWIYIAETHRLTRRRFKIGEARPTDQRPETIATFPDYGLSYKYGGWHLTRTIAFGPNRKLYVSVGSSCNSCIEKESERATVLEMDPDGSNKRIFSSGLRNAVGMRWIGESLFVTDQGADHLGNSRPDESFHRLKDGADYGWPRCYRTRGLIRRDPRLGVRANCADLPSAYRFFPAHSSALGFDYFGSSWNDQSLRGSFVIALHGSTNRSLRRGYKLVRFRKGEKQEDLLTGFLQGRRVNGRPCDVFRLTSDSFLVSDDHGGVVYLIRAKAGSG